MSITPTAATPAADAQSVRPYIIVDAPLSEQSRDGGSLGAAISAEVRRRIVEQPEDGTAPSSAGAIRLTDFTIAEDEDATSSGTVIDAVIAAHAKRVSLLKQRMETLRAEGADADRIADLRIRLHRAEAARRLAVARANVETLAAARCGGDAGAPCRSGLKTATSIPAKAVLASRSLNASRRMPAVQPAPPFPTTSSDARRSFVKTAKAAHGVAAQYPLTFASRSKTRVVVRAAGGNFRSSRVAIDLHIAQRNPFATRLAHARRSLIVARNMLEGGARVPRTAVKPVMRAVGLWRWPGSEQWSLASTRPSTA